MVNVLNSRFSLFITLLFASRYFTIIYKTTCPEIHSTRLNVQKQKWWFYRSLFSQVVCQAGIFHGGKPLCETQKTRTTVISRDGVAQWDQELTFPIKVHNLPRMSRICFGVYEISKSKGKRKGKDKVTIFYTIVFFTLAAYES